MMKMRLAIGFTAALTVFGGVVAPAVVADDYQFMKPQLLEQAVLRAQMPTTLGTWSQNLYFADNSATLTRATVCWGSKGEIRLPAAKNMGAVGYTIGPNKSGTVTIYQFKDQAAADRAKKAMQSAQCSDNPMVPTESETLVQGTSGSDQTDANLTGLAAGETHVEDGMRFYQNRIINFRGLAAVQTQVFQAIKVGQTDKQQQNTASKLSAVNQNWQARAIKALESFGTGNAR